MKTFGELTKEEKLELFTAWLDGKVIESKYSESGEWQDNKNPGWVSACWYRVKVAKPSINWDHVHPDFNWLAVDDSGEAYLYVNRPFIDDDEDLSWDTIGGHTGAKGFASFNHGNCDWKDSLVERPKR